MCNNPLSKHLNLFFERSDVSNDISSVENVIIEPPIKTTIKTAIKITIKTTVALEAAVDKAVIWEPASVGIEPPHHWRKTEPRGEASPSRPKSHNVGVIIVRVIRVERVISAPPKKGGSDQSIPSIGKGHQDQGGVAPKGPSPKTPAAIGREINPSVGIAQNRDGRRAGDDSRLVPLVQGVEVRARDKARGVDEGVEAHLVVDPELGLAGVGARSQNELPLLGLLLGLCL